MQRVTRFTGFCFTAVAAGVVSVQSSPTISGSVEASYNYNLTIPTDSTTNVLHGYDAHSKTFTLNSAHLDIGGSDSASGVGYDVQTDFGSDAMVDANSSIGQGAANYFDIEQAYLTYAFGNGKAWGIKAGKYATYEGIEVVQGVANPEITRGFLFAYAEPITHTGAEVSYSGGMWDLHLGLVNGWDQVMDLNVMPTYLAKLGLNFGNPLALTLSGLVGSEKATGAGGDLSHMRASLDLTGISHAVKMVDLNFQGNYGMEPGAGVNGQDATWYGFGLQPLVHVNGLFGVGLRYEFFDDLDGARTGVDNLQVQNVTVAPTFWLNKTLTARVEYRADFASKSIYLNNNQNSSGYQMELAADLNATF